MFQYNKKICQINRFIRVMHLMCNMFLKSLNQKDHNKIHEHGVFVATFKVYTVDSSVMGSTNVKNRKLQIKSV